MIFIIIPVFNRWHFTRACLLSLKNQNHSSFTIIVVDHGSTDGTSEIIGMDFPEVVLLKGNESMWWTAATNMGVKKALELSTSITDFVLTLNNDLEVNNNYLEELLKVYEINKPCLVGSTSVDINDTNKISVIGYSWNKYTAKYKPSLYSYVPYNEIVGKFQMLDTDLLSGRGTLIPINIFEYIGLFDEINFPHYAADEDFTLRCKKAGYSLCYATKAVVKSHVTATGINSKFNTLTILQFFNSFRSIRSAINLKTRYRWAIKNTSLPYIYFLFDIARICGSYIKTKIKRN